jgi:signal transduction histidine kinase
VPDRAKDLIRIACNNSERLVRLINDILDVEKIESGKMSFDFEPIDLTTLLGQALEANRAFAEQFRVRFVQTESLPGITVIADGDRLTQVITNLLSNAAKFSPPDGVVEVSVRQVKDRVRVSITDHGPGIPEEFRSRIFQKFAQADASDSRQRAVQVWACRSRRPSSNGSAGTSAS